MLGLTAYHCLSTRGFFIVNYEQVVIGGESVYALFVCDEGRLICGVTSFTR